MANPLKMDGFLEDGPTMKSQTELPPEAEPPEANVGSTWITPGLGSCSDHMVIGSMGFLTPKKNNPQV